MGVSSQTVTTEHERGRPLLITAQHAWSRKKIHCKNTTVETNKLNLITMLVDVTLAKQFLCLLN